jgi:hypothetical protein
MPKFTTLEKQWEPRDRLDLEERIRDLQVRVNVLKLLNRNQHQETIERGERKFARLRMMRE